MRRDAGKAPFPCRLTEDEGRCLKESPRAACPGHFSRCCWSLPWSAFLAVCGRGWVTGPAQGLVTSGVRVGGPACSVVSPAFSRATQNSQSGFVQLSAGEYLELSFLCACFRCALSCVWIPLHTQRLHPHLCWSVFCFGRWVVQAHSNSFELLRGFWKCLTPPVD